MHRYVKSLFGSLVDAVVDAGVKIQFAHLLAFEYKKQNVRVGLTAEGSIPYFFAEDICRICDIENPIQQFLDSNVPDKCFAVSNDFKRCVPGYEKGYELVITEDAIYPMLRGSSQGITATRAFVVWMQETILKMAKEKFQYDPDGLLEVALQKAEEERLKLRELIVPVVNAWIAPKQERFRQRIQRYRDALALWSYAGSPADDMRLILQTEYAGVCVSCYRDSSVCHQDLSSALALVSREYFVTQECIGQLLGYKNPIKSIRQLHQRNREVLDPLSRCVNLEVSSGAGQNGLREVVCYNHRGLHQICRLSDSPQAESVLDFLQYELRPLVHGKMSSIESCNHLLDTIEQAGQGFWETEQETQPDFLSKAYQTMIPMLKDHIEADTQELLTQMKKELAKYYKEQVRELQYYADSLADANRTLETYQKTIMPMLAKIPD